MFEDHFRRIVVTDFGLKKENWPAFQNWLLVNGVVAAGSSTLTAHLGLEHAWPKADLDLFVLHRSNDAAALPDTLSWARARPTYKTMFQQLVSLFAHGTETVAGNIAENRPAEYVTAFKTKILGIFQARAFKDRTIQLIVYNDQAEPLCNTIGQMIAATFDLNVGRVIYDGRASYYAGPTKGDELEELRNRRLCINRHGAKTTIVDGGRITKYIDRGFILDPEDRPWYDNWLKDQQATATVGRQSAKKLSIKRNGTTAIEIPFDNIHVSVTDDGSWVIQVLTK